MILRNLYRGLTVFLWSAMFAAVAHAGPIIIGGDDLTDHGGAAPYGVNNQTGWLYIEKAISNLAVNVSRPANDGSIAALAACRTEHDSASESDH